MTDDFGNEWIVGHWTDELVCAVDAVPSGALLPGVKAVYWDRHGYDEARKRSYRAFADSERNCNTCQHLIRVRHPKHWSGFLKGICAHAQHLQAHPYAHLMKIEMTFHPDDPMHMPCYESRFDAG